MLAPCWEFRGCTEGVDACCSGHASGFAVMGARTALYRTDLEGQPSTACVLFCCREAPAAASRDIWLFTANRLFGRAIPQPCSAFVKRDLLTWLRGAVLQGCSTGGCTASSHWSASCDDGEAEGCGARDRHRGHRAAAFTGQ